jgi:hypothetical protein
MGGTCNIAMANTIPCNGEATRSSSQSQEIGLSKEDDDARERPNTHASSFPQNRLRRTARQLKASTNATSEPKNGEIDGLTELTVPMERLMLSIKILRLEKYVKGKRQSSLQPSIENMDMMCDNILKKRIELISIDISEDEFDQRRMTMSRARINLSVAMWSCTWSQQARAIPKLMSTMRHMDSFELFKITKDPRVLFSPKRRGRSAAEHQANQRSKQQAVDPFCWEPGEHIPTSLVVHS